MTRKTISSTAAALIAAVVLAITLTSFSTPAAAGCWYDGASWFNRIATIDSWHYLFTGGKSSCFF